jgi:pyrophosphate--fructose-6-phosphate 1-phosphotransferase
MNISALQKARYKYTAKLPGCLSGSIEEIAVELGGPTEAISDRDELREIFKLT